MQYQELVRRVRRRAGLSSDDQALQLIRATLYALGKRLPQAETRRLAAQLPPALGRWLRSIDTRENFSLDEFYLRVANRTSGDLTDAWFGAPAVIAVLRDLTPPGLMAEVQALLPATYDPLFFPKPSSQVA